MVLREWLLFVAIGAFVIKCLFHFLPLSISEIIDGCAFFISNPSGMDGSPFPWIGFAPLFIVCVHLSLIFLVILGCFLRNFVFLFNIYFLMVQSYFFFVFFNIFFSRFAFSPILIIFFALFLCFLRVFGSILSHDFGLTVFASRRKPILITSARGEVC